MSMSLGSITSNALSSGAQDSYPALFLSLVSFGVPLFVPYLVSDLKTSWLFCVFLEQNLYCNCRLLWQMLSLPQPLFTKIICEKEQNIFKLFLFSHSFNDKGVHRHTQIHTHIRTSETVLFCWKWLRTGVTSGRSALVLVVWLELRRDTVTEMGILCSLSLISRWKSEEFIFCVIV